MDRGVADSARPTLPATAASVPLTGTPRPRVTCLLCEGTGTVRKICAATDCEIPFHSRPCPECLGSGRLRPRRDDVITRAVSKVIAGMGPVRRIP